KEPPGQERSKQAEETSGGAAVCGLKSNSAQKQQWTPAEDKSERNSRQGQKAGDDQRREKGVEGHNNRAVELVSGLKKLGFGGDRSIFDGAGQGFPKLPVFLGLGQERGAESPSFALG